MGIFNEEDYDFTDSLISGIKWDGATLDYTLSIDYYLGKDKNSVVTLSLKNVKELKISANLIDKKDIYTPYTLSRITKRKTGSYTELICESSLSMLPENENEPPLLYCLCDEVTVL